MAIRILPEHIASQIAAGEVIERPASVVKELAENALDAGSQQITIEVLGAGKRLICVTDDGGGIPRAELGLAVSRHATSKLSRAEDLFHIATLGFRGEALASIGSVSRMTVETRPPDAEVGAKLRVEGGALGELVELGMPPGTSITVQDLFYNLPARLKFLKSDTTERRNIEALVTRYALAYPHVRWHLAMEGKTTLKTSGNADRREVLANLYGVEIAKQMLALEFLEAGYHIHGFISPISLTRSNRREITVFVNGRWVRDTAVSAAIIRAYHTLLMVGRFPIVVLFLELPPETVDVNVHPTKAEVRFREGDLVFSRAQRAVRRALMAYSPVTELEMRPWWGAGREEDRSQIDPAWKMAAEIPKTWEGPVQSVQPRISLLTGTEDAPERLPLLRLVGQVAATYLVAEGPDGLYLIDQHAAHERVLFEELMAQQADASVPSQALLTPVSVLLTPEKARLLEDQLPILAGLGFEVEPFGPNTYSVRAIPALLAGGDPEAALNAVVEEFEEDETPLAAAREAMITARVCKRMAVKGGQILSHDEQVALLRALERCQSPRTCPHGRPTMIHLSADLLERQFGRRGAR
ncbi:MAG: DNA mismatch repair protein MutL [Chloroflexi bacterium ADurb.Bin120]|jgi:DNA mismatch repair protein MutL|uniref:DNA mismatch repair protein MutL n=1 Tax=Candidatus Brevifilum fermentans TaxID=1986204 RepID=A0A1Y6K4T5_9CHLR|nr:DNA mismatch repair endonuclease MutL [Brevefilum fermentans]OQB84293.1 MAG: DNA mismatch repair protein MutL [Chloroflexi bacterium ADurb.Bin120]SMX54705.1 DNA mismatch repair protein MutL [Brevefilum fermentans]